MKPIEFFYQRNSRVSPLALRALWPKPRQQRYLLKDATTPLSADPRVWPIAAAGDPSAVQVVLTALDDNVESLQARLGIPEPVEIRDMSLGWQILGYDVCDCTLLSALLNCSYKDEERGHLLSWARKLNESHLFADVEAASGFVAVSNRRIPDHAPFGVFGVYCDSSAGAT
jgi:hypothetical protein